MTSQSAPRTRHLRPAPSSLLVMISLGLLAFLAYPSSSIAQSSSTQCERQMVANACANHGKEDCGRYMYPGAGCRCDGAHKNYLNFVPCYWNERSDICVADFRQEPWVGVCPLRVEAVPTGPIVFMDINAVCPPSGHNSGSHTPYCYLTHPAQAWNM